MPMQNFSLLAEQGLFHQLAQNILGNIDKVSVEELVSGYNLLILTNKNNVNNKILAKISIELSRKITDTTVYGNKNNVLINTLVILLNKENLVNCGENMEITGEESPNKEITESVSNSTPNKDVSSYSNSNITDITANGNFNYEKVVKSALLITQRCESLVRILIELANNFLINNHTEVFYLSKIILYECKNITIYSNSVISELYFGLGLLNFKSTLGYNFLIEYIKIVKSNNYPEKEIFPIGKIVEMAVISGCYANEIYSFNGLFENLQIELPEKVTEKNFNEISLNGKESKSLSMAVAIENDLANLAVKLSEDFGAEITEIVKKKIIVIKLLKYFFNCQNRIVNLNEISGALSLPEKEVEENLLTILGCNLIKGKLNGISKEFTFHWIGYKYLSKKEIKTISTVINEIKKRVDEIVQDL
ncbi:uncharacterized protein NESG_00556 [Nematocida ausubeli]|uniref:PCI domain-containing protein n=1 Tax=Nematocida ausubeli (strain ATCC PRA-371 / ERTm2) TaxID=1913371 RepID=A0A086J5Q9_NEMA1|nr:uncharacterized protein NESG_00556 [Nematocida ausubeli]KFG27477.1 hypothetical protein NESG_00556 [Nematocida ausubeli]